MIDYSTHTIELNSLLKLFHKQCLKNDPAALETCLKIQAEAKLLTNSVRATDQPALET